MMPLAVPQLVVVTLAEDMPMQFGQSSTAKPFQRDKRPGVVDPPVGIAHPRVEITVRDASLEVRIVGDSRPRSLLVLSVAGTSPFGERRDLKVEARARGNDAVATVPLDARLADDASIHVEWEQPIQLGRFTGNPRTIGSIQPLLGRAMTTEDEAALFHAKECSRPERAL